jgi:protoheme ferro-lyase
MQYNDNPQYVYTSFMSNTDKEKEIIKLTKTKEYLNTNIAPLYKDNPSYIQNLNNQIQNYINYLQK